MAEEPPFKAAPVFPPELQAVITEHEWKISEPAYTTLPAINSGYSGILSWEKPAIEKLKNHLLERRIVKDHFPSDGAEGHGQRREFRSSHPQVDTWISKHSKLSGNHLLGCLWSVEELIHRLKKNSVIFPKELEASLADPQQKIGRYNDMLWDQKVALVGQIDTLAHGLFLFLSHPPVIGSNQVGD